MQAFLDKGEKYDVRQGSSKSKMEFSGPGAGMNPCEPRLGDRRPLSRAKPRNSREGVYRAAGYIKNVKYAAEMPESRALCGIFMHLNCCGDPTKTAYFSR